MASVTYDHVVKRYTADLTVVKDFNVEIKDKEFMVLVGPSGCGKSTALRMLAGLEAITEGQIRIGDRVVNNVAAKDRDIAMVFQSYALYPHMSVYDNMAFPLQMQHMKKDEIDKRVKNASRILGLDNFLKRTPRDIYDHPANLFVAGFIGSPTMNFVPATMQNGSAKASGFEVKLPKPVSATKGTLSFRPEAVTDRIVEGSPAMEMKVDVVERLGSDQFLYGQVGSDQVTARVDPRMAVQPGDKVRLGLDIRSLHFFD